MTFLLDGGFLVMPSVTVEISRYVPNSDCQRQSLSTVMFLSYTDAVGLWGPITGYWRFDKLATKWCYIFLQKSLSMIVTDIWPVTLILLIRRVLTWLLWNSFKRLERSWVHKLTDVRPYPWRLLTIMDKVGTWSPSETPVNSRVRTAGGWDGWSPWLFFRPP